jgi:streptomycin 6-kinase
VTPIEIPEIVRNKATIAGATAWLDALPDLVRSIEREWSIAVGAPYGDGTEAYVARATRADGSAAVLKLCVPERGDVAVDEIAFLRLADGHGCARLYESDDERGALLVEQLGPSLADLALPVDRRHEIICATVSQLWRPAPGAPFRTGADKGRWLVEYATTQWEALDRPCSAAAVDYAVECCERRIAAHDDERAVLCHGDAHQWNTLETLDGSGAFKLIDPDGLLAEPEYDLAIPMREDPDAGDLVERAHRLASLTDLDPVAIWEWGVIERVTTGFVCTEIDLQPVAADMLRAAERVAATRW